MESGLTVRHFQPRDLEVVVDIGNRAWQRIYDMFLETYGRDLFEILIPDRKAQKGEQVRAKCTSRPQEVLVCESGGTIVGFAGARVIEETIREKLPDGPVVILSNHQCEWETVYLQLLKPPVCTVLKKELLNFPIFGWGLRLLHPIALDRSKPATTRITRRRSYPSNSRRSIATCLG